MLGCDPRVLGEHRFGPTSPSDLTDARAALEGVCLFQRRDDGGDYASSPPITILAQPSATRKSRPFGPGFADGDRSRRWLGSDDDSWRTCGDQVSGQETVHHERIPMRWWSDFAPRAVEQNDQVAAWIAGNGGSPDCLSAGTLIGGGAVKISIRFAGASGARA